MLRSHTKTLVAGNKHIKIITLKRLVPKSTSFLQKFKGFCKIEVRHTFGKKKICFIDFFLY
jgi:hypothetical protein